MRNLNTPFGHTEYLAQIMRDGVWATVGSYRTNTAAKRAEKSLKECGHTTRIVSR